MIQIINLREQPEYAQRGIQYFQEKWATEENKIMYEDAILRSLKTESPLPIWYLMEDEGQIIGCAGLITNDFISAADLWPWLCALYIEEDRRGKALASKLILRIREDASKAGFPSLYLCTHHIGFYEKYGFRYIGDGYHPWGESTRIYEYVKQE